MTDTSIPQALLRAVRNDLAPVRPLASPERRVLAMLPLAFALLLLPPLYWGWRSNLAALGDGVSWVLSSIESLAGLALLWLAFRASVPGLQRTAGDIRLAILLGAMLFVGITLATDVEVPTVERAGAWLLSVSQCLRMELPFALPSMLAVAWMVARALPDRPALVGAAYGFGVGLMTDAGVRLFCWVSESSHVLVAHGGAMLLSACGGALVAMSIERTKRVRLRLLR